MIYLDSNALIKLIREEDESDALLVWLDERSGRPLVSSELTITEVTRVVRRRNHDDQGRVVHLGGLADEIAAAAELLDKLELLALDRDLLVRAGEVGGPMVRTLDAIHLVSALDLNTGTLEFVTYDRRLSAAARAAGLAVVAPV